MPGLATGYPAQLCERKRLCFDGRVSMCSAANYMCWRSKGGHTSGPPESRNAVYSTEAYRTGSDIDALARVTLARLATGTACTAMNCFHPGM